MSARTQLMLRDQHHGARAPLAEPQKNSRPSPPADAPAKPAPRPTRRSTAWSEERIAQLKACVEAGWTCSRIAAEIGVTRNAVIGKMSRLGLAGRTKKTAPREVKPLRSVPRTRGLVRILARHRVLSELGPASPCGIAATSGPGCTLFELTAGKCRWPINDPCAADFRFCAGPQLQGLPYCLAHARLAYKATAGSA